MAAYAALVSLINNIEQIKIHPRVSTLFDEKQLESLRERVDSLLFFIESYNSYGGGNDEVEDLETQITSAAYSAEDVIESHVVDQLLPEDMIPPPVAKRTDVGSSDEALIQSIIRRGRGEKDVVDPSIEDRIAARSRIPLEMLDLQKIIQDMDSVREIVMKVELPAKSFVPAVSSSPHPAGKSKLVGFDNYSTQLLSKLTGHQADRLVIPIVGMGGVGKTTLARYAYDSLDVVHHFNFRAWIVISQSYILKDSLCEILSCLGESKHDMDEKNEKELGLLLHKTLFGRRYLIVLDDMWSIEAWYELMKYLPDNCTWSRIVVTTRISDVANHFGSMGFELKLLDDDQSWKLLCEKVFPQEVCPPELEESGKKIAKKCKGLPLSIVVIGGLLGSISRTQDQWENVEKDITSILNTTNDNQCLKLLSLSYSHLPARLKPCFLYLGIFPEDSVISVSRIIKLWVAEGFIKPKKDQSLEELAESCIKDLVGRNLVTVHRLRWNGKVKTFIIHDLLRDLGIRVAEKENFLCIASELNTPQEMDMQCRVIIRGSTGVEQYDNTRVLDSLKSKSLPRSLILNRGRKVHVKSRLLRVLDGVYSEPRGTIFQQVNMRFLAQEHMVLLRGWRFSYELPSSISILWNLQTLLMKGVSVRRVDAPSAIWEMPQLRHLMFNDIDLPEPPTGDGILLHNLQTLGRVSGFTFNVAECKRIPNIKKLHVWRSYFPRDRANFASFCKLESLHYELDRKPVRENLLQYLKLPNSLKKLTLGSFPLQWEDLTVISSLPHLEALILEISITGPNWDPVKGEFLHLKYLRIVSSNLECWNADHTQISQFLRTLFWTNSPI